MGLGAGREAGIREAAEAAAAGLPNTKGVLVVDAVVTNLPTLPHPLKSLTEGAGDGIGAFVTVVAGVVAGAVAGAAAGAGAVPTVAMPPDRDTAGRD